MKKAILVLALATLAILNVVAFKRVYRKKPVQTLQLAVDPDPVSPGEIQASYVFVGEQGQEGIQLVKPGDSFFVGEQGLKGIQLVKPGDSIMAMGDFVKISGESDQGIQLNSKYEDQPFSISLDNPFSASTGIRLSGRAGNAAQPRVVQINGENVIYTKGTGIKGTAIDTPQKSVPSTLDSGQAVTP